MTTKLINSYELQAIEFSEIKKGMILYDIRQRNFCRVNIIYPRSIEAKFTIRSVSFLNEINVRHVFLENDVKNRLFKFKFM